jgi:hypothetical protein
LKREQESFALDERLRSTHRNDEHGRNDNDHRGEKNRSRGMPRQRCAEIAMSERDEAARHSAERTVDTEQLVREAHATEGPTIRERDGVTGWLKPSGSAELSSREAAEPDIHHAPAQRH